MHGVAAQPRRIEARGQRCAPRSEVGILGLLAGQGQAQQEQVGAGLVLEQRDDFARATLVEQEVGIRRLQIAVGDASGQRVAEGRFSRLVLA